MKKTLIVFVLCLLTACGPSAISYNDAIISPQLAISADLNRIFSKNSTYESVQKDRLLLIENAEKGLEICRNLPNYKGNSDFRNAANQYYSFVVNYFSTTLDIDQLLLQYHSKDGIHQLSEEQFNQMQANFRHFNELESELMVQQKKFADEFKLKL